MSDVVAKGDWSRAVADSLADIPKPEWLPILARMEEVASIEGDQEKLTAIHELSATYVELAGIPGGDAAGGKAAIAMVRKSLKRPDKLRSTPRLTSIREPESVLFDLQSTERSE